MIHNILKHSVMEIYKKSRLAQDMRRKNHLHSLLEGHVGAWGRCTDPPLHSGLGNRRRACGAERAKDRNTRHLSTEARGSEEEELETTGHGAEDRQGDGLSVDMFLNSISRCERGMRLNFTLINSLILKFLDHKNLVSVLSIEPIFRFARTLPLILVSGYIYLEKYMARVGVVFSDCSKLVKFFLVCCLIGLKFIYDTNCSTDSFLTSWDMAAVEVNYIEGLVLSTINYDIEISNNDIQRVLLQNGLLRGDSKSLDARFHEIIDSWRT